MINLSPNYLNFCRINSKNHNYNKINIQYHQKESNKSNNNFLNNNLFNKCDQRILKNKNIKNNTKRNNKNKTYEKSKIYIFSAPEKIVKK